MRRSRLSAQSRSNLDKRMKHFGEVRRYAAPVRGWIKAVREALGMTTAQLAKRLKVKQPTVVRLEQSEAKGTIEVATLRRVAAALDCTLVYAFAPNRPLEKMVRDQARLFASRRRAAVEHSMLLENQQVKAPAPAKDSKKRIDEIVRETNPKLFWD